VSPELVTSVFKDVSFVFRAVVHQCFTCPSQNVEFCTAWGNRCPLYFSIRKR